MNSRLLFIGLVAVLAVSLSACHKGDAQEKEDEEVVIPVETATVIRGSIDAAYRGTTTLTAREQADVVAKASGIVEQVLVEEGDAVSAGQVLARLETDRLRLEAERARAEMDRLKSDFDRNHSVYQRNLISREAYEQTKFQLDAATAAYDLARLSLRESEIKAPIHGVVSSRLIKIGNTLQANEVAFTVTQLDTLEADVFVPERDIYKLAAGQPAVLRVDAWPDSQFEGHIQRINPVVDPSTGTVEVTVAMTPGQSKLKPGMFGRIEIRYDRHDQATLLPKDAVLHEDGTQSVFVAAHGKARRREVSLGYADADYYEVLEGLESGDQVVVTGQSNLKDDVSISVVNLKPATTVGEPSEQPGEDSSRADPAVAQSDAPHKS